MFGNASQSVGSVGSWPAPPRSGQAQLQSVRSHGSLEQGWSQRHRSRDRTHDSENRARSATATTPGFFQRDPDNDLLRRLEDLERQVTFNKTTLTVHASQIVSLQQRIDNEREILKVVNTDIENYKVQVKEEFANALTRIDCLEASRGQLEKRYS